MSQKIKVCIVSLYSYPLFNPACQGLFGGSEVRMSIIAKGLAQIPELDISLVVLDYGQPEVERIDNVNIYPWKDRPGPRNEQADTGRASAGNTAPSADSQSKCEEEAPPRFGRPGMLFKHLVRRLYWGVKWRALSLYHGRMVLWRSVKLINLLLLLLRNPNEFARLYGLDSKIAEAYRRIVELDRIGNYSIYRRNISIYMKVNADLYLVPGSSEITAEVAYFCRKNGRKSIQLAGSDMDYDPEYRINLGGYNRYGSPHSAIVYAINSVDAHAVQNERQVKLLSQNFGRNSIIINNPIDLTPIGGPALPGRDILWVGKSDTIKRPQIILELARLMPEYTFTLIMMTSNAEIHQAVLGEKQRLPNVRIIEYVPFAEIERYFAAHRLLINTSTIEGFPNTFLQSIKYGHPVISLRVDPGRTLTKHHCGGCANDNFEEMHRLTRRMLEDPEAYAQTSQNCLDYIREFHDRDKIIRQYVELIQSVVTY